MISQCNPASPLKFPRRLTYWPAAAREDRDTDRQSIQIEAEHHV
jgi:hypothetical protein